MRVRSKALTYIWIFFMLLCMYLPILILAVYSFSDATQIGQPMHFASDNYLSLINNPDLRNMIINTFVLAFVSAVLSTILGTSAAIGVHFGGRNRVGKLISFMNQIPIVNADVVTGFSICILLMVFIHMDKSTYIPLVIGHMTLCTPFVYLAVRPNLKLMDMHHYEAALDLGATPSYAMFGVVIKELIPSIIAGFVTSVTLSLDDYFITTYTKPAVFDTISTYVVNATKGAQTNIKTALWALSTVIFILVMVFVLLTNMGGLGNMIKKKKGGHRR